MTDQPDVVRRLAAAIKAAHDAGPQYRRWERAAKAVLAELRRIEAEQTKTPRE